MMVTMAIDAIGSCHIAISTALGFQTIAFVDLMAITAGIDATDQDLAGMTTQGRIRGIGRRWASQIHLVALLALHVHVRSVSKASVL
jgi:hypothetical protein